jgi:hypothetical protein
MVARTAQSTSRAPRRWGCFGRRLAVPAWPFGAVKGKMRAGNSSAHGTWSLRWLSRWASSAKKAGWERRRRATTSRWGCSGTTRSESWSSIPTTSAAASPAGQGRSLIQAEATREGCKPRQSNCRAVAPLPPGLAPLVGPGGSRYSSVPPSPPAPNLCGYGWRLPPTSHHADDATRSRSPSDPASTPADATHPRAAATNS